MKREVLPERPLYSCPHPLTGGGGIVFGSVHEVIELCRLCAGLLSEAGGIRSDEPPAAQESAMERELGEGPEMTVGPGRVEILKAVKWDRDRKRRARQRAILDAFPRIMSYVRESHKAASTAPWSERDSRDVLAPLDAALVAAQEALDAGREPAPGREPAQGKEAA